MKSVSILMSFMMIVLFSPASIAQICHVDANYYYHHNSKRSYKHERKSIIDFKKRINQGVWSGELTRKEERYLKRKLNKLLRYESRAFENGHISRRERRKIERKKEFLDHLIYDKKHNRHVKY